MISKNKQKTGVVSYHVGVFLPSLGTTHDTDKVLRLALLLDAHALEVEPVTARVARDHRRVLSVRHPTQAVRLQQRICVSRYIGQATPEIFFF